MNNCFEDVVGGEAALGAEFLDGAVLDEAVWDSKTGDADVRGVLRDVGGYCVVQTACDRAVFDGDDSGNLGAHVLHDVLVERLEKAHVVVED